MDTLAITSNQKSALEFYQAAYEGSEITSRVENSVLVISVKHKDDEHTIKVTAAGDVAS